MKYPKANRRKCYWLCPDCLKGHKRCSINCPDYLSVAQAQRQIKERQERILEKEVMKYVYR